jgi:iron complex outermembrane receptor protein
MSPLFSRIASLGLLVWVLSLPIAYAQGVSPEKKKTPAGFYTLSGFVLDEKTKTPLVGATIYLPEDRRGTLTNEKGYYSIPQLTAGHHVVEVSYTGYGTFVAHIELGAALEKNFNLAPVYLENQGVVITGISTATSIRKTSAPMSIVRQQQLMETPATNIIDALSKVSGLSQISTGPAVSKPVIRGLGYNRVVVVNDGVRQEGQQWGDEHGIEIDENSVNKVEILKGPSSLLYGSDALAGVIHLISAPAVEEGSIKGQFNTQYQTNSRLTGNSLRLAGMKSGLNWSFYGTLKSAGDYKNRYDGYVLNSRFNEKNGGGQVGINKSWGYSHLLFSHFNQQLGMIEGDRDATTGNFLLFGGTSLERFPSQKEVKGRSLFVPSQQVQHNRVVWDNNFIVGASRLKLNIGWQQNRRKEFGEPEDPSEEELYFDLKTLSYSLQWKLPEQKEWHTTIGVNGMRQHNANKGAELLIPDYQLFDAGLFVYTQRIFDKTTWSGGLRLDTRSLEGMQHWEGTEVKFEGFRRNFTNWSGSVGVSYEPSDNVILKANMARGFRAPTLAELSSNGTHEGTNRYEYGRKDLRAETSFQLDAGIELEFEHFNLGVSAFRNSIQDFIFYRKLLTAGGLDSLVEVDGEELTAFTFQQQNAVLSGLELQLDIHPHPIHWLHLENTFSWVHGNFDRLIDPSVPGSDRLPLIPAPRWNAELRGDFKKGVGAFRNLYIRFEAEKNFAQQRFFSGFNTETMTPGYLLLDAGVGASLVNRQKQTKATVHLSVTNLGNVAWQSHLSRLKYTMENPVTGRQGVFSQGRNFTLKVQVPLLFKKAN